MKRLLLDGIEPAVCSEGDGCKVGRVLERVIPDGGDGCGDDDGGERGAVERASPDGCDGCGDLDGGDIGTSERVSPDLRPPRSEFNDDG